MLGAMPSGSLGRSYYDFMDHPETIPGYMLSGMIYKDAWIDTVAMSGALDTSSTTSPTPN